MMYREASINTFEKKKKKKKKRLHTSYGADDANTSVGGPQVGYGVGGQVNVRLDVHVKHLLDV